MSDYVLRRKDSASLFDQGALNSIYGTSVLMCPTPKYMVSLLSGYEAVYDGEVVWPPSKPSAILSTGLS